MRKRTPSEIKAYGDGYAEAYKEFCHLLDRHDKDKAIRKMKIFADAVALTVETATGEPQTNADNAFQSVESVGADRKTEPSNSEKPNNCEHITEDGVTCAKYPACDDCLDNPLNKLKGSERLVKGYTEKERASDVGVLSEL